MSEHKLPPSPGLPPDKSGPANVGGSPPPQPQKPQPPDPKEKHPVADSKANVDHGPFVPGKTDKQADVKDAGSLRMSSLKTSGRQMPREDDKGPASASVGLPGPAISDHGHTIRFDWYPDSFAQAVTLHRGNKALVESIVGKVITAGTDPGPTALTFRKVPSGSSLTGGKALHTGSIDLIGPVNADISGIEQAMAMVPEHADRTLQDGDIIAADFSGAMANARGTATIRLSEVKEDERK